MLRLVLTFGMASFMLSSAESDNMGNHYVAKYGKYTEGAWNYDYSQVADKCPVCSVDLKCGPACWDKVVPSDSNVVNQCGEDSQTPINFGQVVADTDINYLDFLDFDVSDEGCDEWAQFADDHAYEVSFADEGCENLKVTSSIEHYHDSLASSTTYDPSLSQNKVEYTLAQFHFHTPAEHSVGGGLADGELHMVHFKKNSAGKVTSALVIGVMLVASPGPDVQYNENLNNRPVQEIGTRNVRRFVDLGDPTRRRLGDVSTKEANIFMSIFRDAVTGHPSNEYVVHGVKKPLNPYESILPASRNFFTYSGSLTTYPCSEIVSWIVFEEPVVVSSDDIAFLRTAVERQENTITFPGPTVDTASSSSSDEETKGVAIAAIVVGSVGFVAIASWVVFYFVSAPAAAGQVVSNKEVELADI